MAKTNTPRWPARRLVVSGPIDRSIQTVVDRFIAEKFRVVSPSGTLPVVLECGSRNLPMLFASLWFVPGKIGENSRFGQVTIEADAASAGALVVTLTEAIAASQVVPLVLRAVEDAAAILDDAEVLVELGPVYSAR